MTKAQRQKVRRKPKIVKSIGQQWEEATNLSALRSAKEAYAALDKLAHGVGGDYPDILLSKFADELEEWADYKSRCSNGGTQPTFELAIAVAEALQRPARQIGRGRRRGDGDDEDRRNEY